MLAAPRVLKPNGIEENRKGRTMNVNGRVAAILAFAITSAVWGQQSAPPKPADNAPSRATAMQMIQKALSERGKIDYVIHAHDTSDNTSAIWHYSSEVSNVVADPASCTIRYNWKKVLNQDDWDDDFTFDLSSVRSVVVMGYDQYEKEQRASGNILDEQKSWEMKFDPPTFLVIARDAEGEEAGFDFANEKTAQEMARMLTHAAQLCGGAHSSPH